MKKYFTHFLLLGMTVAALPACRETSRIPEPAYESLPLIIPEFSKDTAKAYFNRDRARLSDNNLQTSQIPIVVKYRSRPVFEFTINFNNNRDRKVKTVEVYKSFERVSSADFPRGNRVLVGSYDSFPATVSMNSQEALTGLYRLISNAPARPYLLALKGATAAAPNPIFAGDAIVFTFEYILEDGTRIILTPVNKTTVGNSPAPANTPPPFPTVDLITGSQINAPYAIRAVFQDRF